MLQQLVNYTLKNPDSVFSPGLLFYVEVIERNIDEAIRIAGDPSRLRPHVKTHKTPRIVRMMLDRGITRHKAATIAEAEMLAQTGAPDVLLAYPVVGPNMARLIALKRKYPATRFAALVDDAENAAALGAAMSSADLTLDVFLDLNVGQHRTGVAPDAEAANFYRALDGIAGLRPVGLSAYDGHNTASGLADRQCTGDALIGIVLNLRQQLERDGLAVPHLVVGGTPQFTVHAGRNIPGLELSPGTFVLHDVNYGPGRYADLAGFHPAALLLTRVVSRPGGNRVTFDVGHKAVSADSGPVAQRLTLLDVPEAELLLQSEEHLVVATPQASRFHPGDVAYAIPSHVCPTVALHDFAYVVRDGQVVDQWQITARRRVIEV